jgi:hypothetical protein
MTIQVIDRHSEAQTGRELVDCPVIMCEEEEFIRWIFPGGMGDTVGAHELI